MNNNRLLSTILVFAIIIIAINLIDHFMLNPQKKEVAPVSKKTKPLTDKTDSSVLQMSKKNHAVQLINFSDNYYHASFSSKHSGVIQSLNLTNPNNPEQKIPLLLTPSGQTSNAFSLSLENQKFIPSNNTFLEKKPHQIIFTSYFTKNKSSFEVQKFIDFSHSSEYVVQVKIRVFSLDHSFLPIHSYNLYYGPQIEADQYASQWWFKVVDQNTNNLYNKKYIKGQSTPKYSHFKWVSMSTPYIACMAMIKPSSLITAQFTQQSPGFILPYKQRPSGYVISRHWQNKKQITDVYNVYIGPLTKKYLTVFNSTKTNSIGVSNMHLEALLPKHHILGWLVWILLQFLNLFYAVIPNWGVDIILLTVFVRILVYPLNVNSYESSYNLQKMGPKVKALRERYKDEPRKAQLEIQKLYSSNGLGIGCLGLIIQLPIFFALFYLLRSDFNFKGSVFIPGWISDLSVPDTVYSFGQYFTLPFLGWNALHILPFILLVIQIFNNRYLLGQNASMNTSPKQGKFMIYIISIVTFLIGYNWPSGLLIYWIVSTSLAFAQQAYVRRSLARKYSLLKEENQ